MKKQILKNLILVSTTCLLVGSLLAGCTLNSRDTITLSELKNKTSTAEEAALNVVKLASTLYMDSEHLDSEPLKELITEETWKLNFSEKTPPIGIPDKVERYLLNVEHSSCEYTGSQYLVMFYGSETLEQSTYHFTAYLELNEDLIVSQYRKYSYR